MAFPTTPPYSQRRTDRLLVSASGGLATCPHLLTWVLLPGLSDVAPALGDKVGVPSISRQQRPLHFHTPALLSWPQLLPVLSGAWVSGTCSWGPGRWAETEGPGRNRWRWAVGPGILQREPAACSCTMFQNTPAPPEEADHLAPLIRALPRLRIKARFQNVAQESSS